MIQQRKLQRQRYWRYCDAAKRRDLAAALLEMLGTSDAPFVWPDTYCQVYYYQRVSKFYADCLGADRMSLPVLMRGARHAIYAKFTKDDWAVRVFERYIRFYKLTIVDRPLSSVFQDVFRRLHEKHYIVRADSIWLHRAQLRECVVVHGKKVPLDGRRIRALEKGLRAVEKLGALKAA